MKNDDDVDDLFHDFGTDNRRFQPTPNDFSHNQSQAESEHEAKQRQLEERQRLVYDKRETIELFSYKISMVFLEKVLIVLKNNQLSEGKCMGHVGVEFASYIDPQEAENVVLNATFTEFDNIWTDSSKLKKNANPSLKTNESLSSLSPYVSVYNLNDFSSNILLYEYQLNPKQIKLIPLSVQYRTAIIDGLLKVKIF